MGSLLARKQFGTSVKLFSTEICLNVHPAAGVTAHFHTGNPPRCVRFRGYRFRTRRPQNSEVLIDKFVKHTKYAGSLIVKAPFHVKCRGSFFDDHNNVDRERNKSSSEPFLPSIYSSSQQSPPLSDDQLLKRELTRIEDDTTSRQFTVRELTRLEEEIMSKIESNRLDDYDGEKMEGMTLGDISRTRLRKCPLHMLLYGRMHHRCDSYSVVMERRVNPTSQSHLFITDAPSFDDALTMFPEHPRRFEPDGSVSVWQPKPVTDLKRATDTNEDEMSASIKLYCPPHILNDHDDSIKMVFLVPTTLKRIYIQSEKTGNVELDGTLIQNLSQIGLNADVGNIKVKEIEADDIKLASRFGDILCEGTLMAHQVTAETFGDGDFLARHVDGGCVTVTTENGDINVWGDCHASVSQFYTINGHINVRYMYNQSYMLVRETGNITLNLIEGNVTATTNRGNIYASIESIDDSSFLRSEYGDVTVTIPPRPAFRISAKGTTINLPPRLLNAGEVSLSSDGREQFASGDLDSLPGSSAEQRPVLSITVGEGTINIHVTEAKQLEKTKSLNALEDDVHKDDNGS